MSGLREQLLGGQPGLPPFRLMLPSGWVAHATTAESEAGLLDAAKSRLMQAHQPAAYATLHTHVSQALSKARAQGTFAMIVPGEGTPRALLLPVSILVGMMVGESGMPLDAQISRAIEERGARPLERSQIFLRWIDRRTVTVDGDSVRADTIVYVTPVPGSQRSRALRFTATLAYPLDVDPETDETVQGWIGLIDAHLATFAWGAP